jgi:hypothetical protein
VELTQGAQTRNLGTLATSSSTQAFTWTVKGTTDGLKSITASAQASRYGETFTSTATDSFTVDATAPSPSIAAPQGQTTQRELAVAWGASDAHSAIAHYELEHSTNGGPWTPWLASTTQTNATLAATPNRRYRFRVRATDSLGHTSPWVESTEATVVEPTTAPPTDPNPGGGDPTPSKTTPDLKLTRVKRTRTGLSIDGRTAASATGTVTVTYTTKLGRKTYRARRTARLTRGRWKTTLKLAASARKPTRGTVELKYRGDASFTAQTVRRSVIAR